MSEQSYASDVRTLGLHVGFLSYKKLFISQIKEKIETRIDDASQIFIFYFENQPLSKVNVVGMVRRYERRPKKAIFHIDDGTGVIVVIKFLSEGEMDQSIFSRNIEIGTLLSVKGHLMKIESNTTPYDYAIKASIVDTLSDPNLELLHWASTMQQQEAESISKTS